MNNDVRRARNYAMQPPIDPAPDRRLPGRQELQQVPGLPRARARPRSRRRVAGQRHALHGPRRQLARRQSRRGATSASSATWRRTDVQPLVENRFEDVDASREAQRPRRQSDEESVAMLDLLKRYWRVIRRPERPLQPGLPDDRRLHRRHRVLGRLQHRDGGHQHRGLLHRLPRDARQRVRRAQEHDPLHQPLAACARCAPTATCRTTGPTRWRARCRPRRRCGARSSAPSTRARSSVDMRLELAQHEWARLKANDSLECRNCHEYDSMDFTRQSMRAQNMHSTYLAQQGEDLHRLPQGHRAPAAAHPGGRGAHRHAGTGRAEARPARSRPRPLHVEVSPKSRLLFSRLLRVARSHTSGCAL